MPMYDYRCENCKHEFEDMTPMAWSAWTACPKCEGTAQKVILSAPRIDPNADLPSQRALWRRKAEERGRGKDMTSANKEVGDEATLRQAHAKRAAMGENKIITS